MTGQLKPGLKGQLQKTVEEQYRATHIGSGKIPVLATPAMIGFMEWAATELVQPYLPDGFTTVGTPVDVRHLAATPVGMKVTFQAELIQVEGRTLTFRVTAEDEKEKVGEGTHQRAIIDVARFQSRVRAKTVAGT
jgi:predicted thioesterase